LNLICRGLIHRGLIHRGLIHRILISGFALVLYCTASVSAAAVGTLADKDKDVARARSRSATADILYQNPLPISNWRNVLFRDPQTDVAARSVPLAFGLSAVIPGLGQAYNRDWIAAAIFVAAEAVLVASFVSWKNSGNQGVEEYQQFAHQNWSPIQYAEWLNDFSGYNGPDVDLPSLTEQDFQRPEGWSVAQRAEVDGFFRDIRTAERASMWPTTGASFSHVLPFFGEQQYYELIGKYFQYAPAWTGPTIRGPRMMIQSMFCRTMPISTSTLISRQLHKETCENLRSSVPF